MPQSWKRTLAATVVALALLAGGAAAFAATQSGPPTNGVATFLDDVARHLGVSPAKLKGAVQAAELDRLNRAVADGKISAARAAKIRARIQAGNVAFWGPLAHPHHRHAVLRGGVKAAAAYLGMQPKELMAQVRQGKSLAQIADATPGKSSQGLQQHLLSAAQQRLAAAVSAGKITPAQQAEIQKTLPARIAALVNRVWQPKPAQPK